MRTQQNHLRLRFPLAPLALPLASDTDSSEGKPESTDTCNTYCMGGPAPEGHHLAAYLLTLMLLTCLVPDSHWEPHSPGSG